MIGEGVDRHLFALCCVAMASGAMPDFLEKYKHSTWADSKIKNWELSTRYVLSAPNNIPTLLKYSIKHPIQLCAQWNGRILQFQEVPDADIYGSWVRLDQWFWVSELPDKNQVDYNPDNHFQGWISVERRNNYIPYKLQQSPKSTCC